MLYNKYPFITFAALFMLFTVSKAQVTRQWEARYNGEGIGNNNAHLITVDASGNIYVTGESEGNGTNFDYATIKYNSSGVLQWVQRYNGPGNNADAPNSIAVDASGNVYVTGESDGSGSYYDFATIKYNSSGIEQWVQRYNGAGNGDDAANSIAVDASGNVYVTGYGWIGASYDYVTIKYNSDGVQQWVQRYNGPGNNSDYANSIAVDVSGNVYVTGESFGSGTGSDYTTIKYSPAGVEQWVQRYNGPGNGDDEAVSIAVDAFGNVYVTGESEGNGTSADCTTIKYNSSGSEQWTARYNGPGNGSDHANSLVIDALGSIYIAGNSFGSGTSFDYATIKYNPAGVEQWVQRYNGTDNSDDEANSIAVDASGNVYVTGTSVGKGSYYDCVTIKYNSLGGKQWVTSYNGPENKWDFAKSIAVDDSGNVYVTGRSHGSGTKFEYLTIKYR